MPSSGDPTGRRASSASGARRSTRARRSTLMAWALAPASAFPANATRSSPLPGAPRRAPWTSKRALPDGSVLAVASIVPPSLERVSGNAAAGAVASSSSSEATTSRFTWSSSRLSVGRSGSKRSVTGASAKSTGSSEGASLRRGRRPRRVEANEVAIFGKGEAHAKLRRLVRGKQQSIARLQRRMGAALAARFRRRRCDSDRDGRGGRASDRDADMCVGGAVVPDRRSRPRRPRACPEHARRARRCATFL